MYSHRMKGGRRPFQFSSISTPSKYSSIEAFLNQGWSWAAVGEYMRL